MPSNIKATPRKKLSGALSDAFQAVNDFASKPFGYENPPGRMLASLAQLPDIAQTLDRISYDEPLTTGRGMTTTVRPEVLNAALAVAPFVGPAAKGAGQAALTIGKAGEHLAERSIPKIMERGGLPAELLQDLAQDSASNMLRRGGRQDLVASHSARMEDLLQGSKKKLVPEITHMSAAIQKGKVDAPWGDTTFIVRPNALDPATSPSIIHSRDAWTPLSSASSTRMFALPQYANRADLQTLAKKLKGRWDDRWTAYDVRGGENAVPGGDIVANNRFNSYRGFERSPYGADNLDAKKAPSARARELLDDLKRHVDNENFYALDEDEFAETLTVPDAWREILRNKQSIEDFSPAEQHKLFQELRNAPREYSELKVFGNVPVNRDTFSGALVRKFPGTTGNKAQAAHHEVYQQLLSDLDSRGIPVLERTMDPTENFRRAVQLQEQSYAQGGSVKNPEQMTHKKFVPGANPLVQIPRGWVAGTAGLPGDIEGLARLFAKYAGAPNSLAEKWGQQETPTLPTSEFYKEWLPLKDEGIGAAELNTLGSFTGGVGSTTLAGLAAKYGTKATKAAVANAAVPSRLSKQAGVIKAKGLAGNWLAGSLDSALSSLKRSNVPMPTAKLEAIADSAGLDSAAFLQLPIDARRELIQKFNVGTPEGAISSFIDKQLTNYIKSDMATPTDPVRLAIEAWPEKKQKLQGLAQAKLDFLNAKTQRLMAERDVPEEFLTRHRQEVLAAEKAKDRIDLQEASHMPVNELQQANDWVPENLGLRRMGAGFPVHGLGVSDAAKGWESIADQSLHNLPAGARLDPVATSIGSVRKFSAENPWLHKVPPETMTYGAHSMSMTGDLGFTHLIDELKNATNSASGLPKDLLLDPSTLGKTTLPQAVEHVAKINAWRAAQQAEADLVKANNAATVLHKDYPEKGMKWVELKAGKELPEGYKIENLENVPTLYGPNGKSLAQNWDYDTLVAQANRPVLEDALRYEGDTMVHCVGGYCPDVAEGRSRIYSLRDAKGRPHTTIEVAPGKMPSLTGWFEELPEEAVAAAKTAMPRGDFAHGPLVRKWIANNWKGELTESPSSILQIKGYKNLKPADEYLPYVQDFVKSGNWSDVKDLQNTGLVRYNKAFLDPTEYAGVKQKQAEALRFMETHPAFEQARQTSTARNKFEHKYGTPEYNALEKAYGQPIHPDMPYTYDEIMATVARPEETYSRGDDLADILEPALDRVNKLKAIHGDLPEGFAQGGSVYSPARVDEIVTQHRNSEYDPARVDSLVAQLKEEMYA
jgi:hypothetical protein